MSVTLFGYLEARAQDPQSSWRCISHSDSFNGIDFDSTELNPDICYPLPQSDFQKIVHSLSDVIRLKSSDLSSKLRREYQALSYDVTGNRTNGLQIYSITFGDFCKNYNQLVQTTNRDAFQEQTLDYLAAIIRRLANAYYFPLCIGGHTDLINPDKKHLQDAPKIIADRVRLVLWQDA